MKVHYDNEVDAIYIKFSNRKPDGVVEISEGVNLDTTSEDKIVGIEILNASKRMNIKTILSYELELDNKSIKKTAQHQREGRTSANSAAPRLLARRAGMVSRVHSSHILRDAATGSSSAAGGPRSLRAASSHSAMRGIELSPDRWT